MKRFIIAFGLVVFIASAALPSIRSASAAGPQWVTVQWGDTLISIAVRYGTTVEALMRANNLPNPNFVYAGQRLLIPESSSESEPEGARAASAPTQPPAHEGTNSIVYYTVRPGDTLAAIATRFGVPLQAIIEANSITNTDFVWYGQRLVIPGAASVGGKTSSEASQSAMPAPPPFDPPTEGKWIGVNVTDQTITAYQGATPLKTVKVSTGLPRTPTVLGTYKILSKYPAVHMRGGTPGVDYYDLPNVPWTMFFFKGYAIHGTYWHKNFGRPMSHGCVNLPTDEAKWFYDWAEIGTPVVSYR